MRSSTIGLSTVICLGIQISVSKAQTRHHELDREVLALASLVGEPTQVAHIEHVYSAHTECNGQHQYRTGLCSNEQTIVPFTLSGDGSAVWTYIARFRKLAQETSAQADVRRFLNKQKQHYALMDFAYVSLDLGDIKWDAGRIDGASVSFPTIRRDHESSDNTGSVRIDLGATMKISHIDQHPIQCAPMARNTSGGRFHPDSCR